MEQQVRDQLMNRLVDRMARAIPGESRAVVFERYAPVFSKMTDQELARVRERASTLNDSYLYLIDENIYKMLEKRGKSPLVGSFAARMFDAVAVAPRGGTMSR